jgi:hypothetical protein
MGPVLLAKPVVTKQMGAENMSEKLAGRLWIVGMLFGGLGGSVIGADAYALEGAILGGCLGSLSGLVCAAMVGGLWIIHLQSRRLGKHRDSTLEDYLWLFGAVAGSAAGAAGAYLGLLAGVLCGLTAGSILGALQLIRRNRAAIETLPVEIEPRRIRDFLAVQPHHAGL